MSRAPKSQRVESERRVLECVLRGGKETRAKDLRNKSGVAPGTLHSVLRDLEERGILEARRERHQTTYVWTKKAGDYYQAIIPRPIKATRRHYELLTRLVPMDATPETFVRHTIPAIGITVLPVLLEALTQHDEVLIQPVIDDFLLFVKKYIINRKYPETEKDVRKELTRLDSAYHELDEHPESFKSEIGELRTALGTLQEELRKELGGR
jgi:DNA-binding MarR family transcriptional regulator